MYRPWSSEPPRGAGARRLKSHWSGVTLAEVMVALVVLSLAIFGLIGARAYALRARSVSVERRAAVVLAASALEDAERTLRHDFQRSTAQTKATHPSNPNYEMEILESTESATLKRVEVRMSWSDKNGPQTHRVWTLVYDRSR